MNYIPLVRLYKYIIPIIYVEIVIIIKYWNKKHFRTESVILRWYHYEIYDSHSLYQIFLRQVHKHLLNSFS